MAGIYGEVLYGTVVYGIREQLEYNPLAMHFDICLPIIQKINVPVVYIDFPSLVIFLRHLSSFDYDDSIIGVLFNMAYWDGKTLDELDFKESEEYL